MMTIELGVAIAVVSFLVGLGIQWGMGMTTLKDHTRRIAQLETDSRHVRDSVSDLKVMLAKATRSIKNEVRKGRVVLIEEDEGYEED